MTTQGDEAPPRTASAADGAGPKTAKAIAAFTGSAAKEPIRAYAGTLSAEDVEARADLAVPTWIGPGASTAPTCWWPRPPGAAGWILARSTASST